jgi:glycerol kinase
MLLVIDVGTSNVRVCAVDGSARLVGEARRPFPPTVSAPGLAEFDAAALWSLVQALCSELTDRVRAAGTDPVWRGVGISNQRASTVVWDRASGQPVAPALGWQDLRTLGTCLALQADGFAIPPNATATKAAAILDGVDGARDRDLCIGTIDSWLAWCLTGRQQHDNGHGHVTDATNAAATGLTVASDSGSVQWDPAILRALNIPERMLPAIVDTSGLGAPASAIDGAPPLAALVGDQQASLAGQGCVRPGAAKATFGTGGMLDVITGNAPPLATSRNHSGTIPIAVRSIAGSTTWGVEAIMLSAGSAVDWLRDDLGMLATAADSERIANECVTSGDVWFVPSLLGMATPAWDYGARGTLVGLTRGSGRAEIVRAVLNGIAHRGADLLDAAEADSGCRVEVLRVDGGMSDNARFTQLLADATGRRIEVSPEREATALGAGLLAGLTVGMWSSVDELAGTWRPVRVAEPTSGPDASRERWADAVAASRGWIPALSALRF